MSSWKTHFIEELNLDVTILHTSDAPLDRMKEFFKVGKNKRNEFIKMMDDFTLTDDSSHFKCKLLIDTESLDTESDLFLYLPNPDICKHGLKYYISLLSKYAYVVADDLTDKFKPEDKTLFISNAVETIVGELFEIITSIIENNNSKTVKGITVAKLLKE